MISRLLRWLNSESDRRVSPRKSGEGLLAFYWDGDVPRGHRVIDISRRGMYVETGSVSWSRGTVMILTLQLESDNGDDGQSPETVAVQAEVVRTSSSGMGLRFLFPKIDDRRSLFQFLSRCKPVKTNGRVHATSNGSLRGSEHGGSILEFALIFPLMFLLIVNVINFGSFMFAWITVANATRAGAQYWVTGGATVSAPATPTEAQVAAVITQDISSLLNRGSLQVEACTNNKSSGTAVITCTGGYGSVTPPVDPESANYVSATVDVKYTFNPPVSLWSFTKLNIVATLPSTTIHRSVAMRVMN